MIPINVSEDMKTHTVKLTEEEINFITFSLSTQREKDRRKWRELPEGNEAKAMLNEDIEFCDALWNKLDNKIKRYES